MCCFHHSWEVRCGCQICITGTCPVYYQADDKLVRLRGEMVWGSYSSRDPPGRGQFRRDLPGSVVGGRLADEKRVFCPVHLSSIFYLLEYPVNL